MLLHPCIPCQHGDHKRHIAMPEVPMPGVMGGQSCPCKGECADRAGERADAIPEAAVEAAARELHGWRFDDDAPGAIAADDLVAARDILLAAAPFLRAAQPEAGNEEGEWPCPTCNGGGRIDLNSNWHGPPGVERHNWHPCPDCDGTGRAAHPEADRAPETCESCGWTRTSRCSDICCPILASDRAPGEVETVARVMAERLMGDKSLDWTNFTWLAEQVIAALDAVRGRSRDDTVTLGNEMAAAILDLRMHEGRSAWDRAEIARSKWLARFGGAGRPETQEENG